MKKITKAKLSLSIAALLMLGSPYSDIKIRASRNDYLAQNPVVAKVESLTEEMKYDKNTSLVSRVEELKSSPEYQANFKKNERIINRDFYTSLGGGFIASFLLGGPFLVYGLVNNFPEPFEEVKK